MNRERIIDTLKDDEGFRSLAYWDKKQWTYGHGCRAPGEGATITRGAAAVLLQEHLDQAAADFARIFKGHESKFNEAREEAFIQLIFNMGPGRKGDPGAGGLQSFVHTLGHIFKNAVVPWESVAKGLETSLWFHQVGKSGDPDGGGPRPGRGERIVAQVRSGLV